MKRPEQGARLKPAVTRKLFWPAVLGVALQTCALSAAEWPLPPLGGELAGEFTPLKIAGAPTLRWKIELQGDPAARLAAKVIVDGPGTSWRGSLRQDEAGGVGWTADETRFDLAAWSAALAGALGVDFVGAATAGVLQVTGRGTWRESALAGRAEISLREGRVDLPAHKFLLEGIALDLALVELGEPRSAPAQTLAWTGGRYDTMAIGAGRIVFSLTGREVRVEAASVALLGGQVMLEDWVFSTDRAEAVATARVSGIEVAQLMPLLPPVLAEARGRLDGTLALRWDARGLAIGAGRLALRAGEAAELRLAPTPGLLSTSLPPAVLKFYPGLGKIETGEIPLRAELLEVAFTPEGDAEGRTASIHLTGGPFDPKLRAPIDLTVNVRGPLESLVKFGTNSRLHFGGTP